MSLSCFPHKVMQETSRSWVGGWMDGRTDGQTDGWMERCVYVDKKRLMFSFGEGSSQGLM